MGDRMGRRPIDQLLAAKKEIASASARLATVFQELDGMRKSAQDDEPKIEPPAEAGGAPDAGDEADLGDLGDLGDADFKDEGTTGEEGAEGDLGGDMGDMGDLGGGFGGGGGAGGFGGGAGGDLGGDLGEDGEQAPPDANEELRGDVDGLRSELDAVQRQLVDISKVLQQVRNPLGDPARGNDALHST